MHNAQPRQLLLLVCLVALLSTVGMALPYPILTPMFVAGPADAFTRFGGAPPEWLLGIALAVNPLGLLIGSFWLGPWSDRYGRRPVLMATLLAGTAANALTAYAIATRNYPLFVLARFATGLTEGNVAIARAMLADAFSAADHTHAFSWLNAFAYAGWLVGPLLGGWAVGWSAHAPFLLAAALNLLPLWIAWRVLPAAHATAPDPAAPPPPPARGALRILRDHPDLRRLACAHVAFTLGVNALYEYAPLWLVQRMGFGSTGIAWATAAQCAVMVGASAGATWSLAHLHRLLPATRSNLATTAVMAATAAVGLLVLAAGQPVTGLTAMLLLGLPLALYNAVLPGHLASRYAHLGQGRVMGMMTTWFCVANVIMSLVGGLLGWLDVRLTMALGAAVCLLAAWLLSLIRHGEPDRGSPALIDQTVA